MNNNDNDVVILLLSERFLKEHSSSRSELRMKITAALSCLMNSWHACDYSQLQ